ncbi:hypothetical protein MC378_11135 [Polaribacter sp. MSW13]|uniref:Uncharacterized protein n=1 Tax=Polaribacter marinus TaxID=2916838 RepID=A0A9X2AJQ4_9FLAO|nr:hypothetical protein [Polaribacter marinus]MCI2229721.1 hypothetical protein [Polaribacter marinus]
MDNITIDAVKASSPTTLYFNEENNILKFSMLDYGKSPDPNFVITYGETLKNFNFKKITTDSETYFKTIDRFSEENFNTYNFANIDIQNPYKVDGISNNAVGFIFYLAIYGLPILLSVLTLIILLLIYKKFIKKK